MAAIIYQTDKRTGITYAYESISHWDKEKKQSRARRTLIGKVDPDNGEIVPTRKKGASEDAGAKKPGPVPTMVASRSFYGATYLFDAIGRKLGIADDLKKCFPETHNQILSTAYYLILEDTSPLSRFSKWAALHKHPLYNVIESINVLKSVYWLYNYYIRWSGVVRPLRESLVP